MALCKTVELLPPFCRNDSCISAATGLLNSKTYKRDDTGDTWLLESPEPYLKWQLPTYYPPVRSNKSYSMWWATASCLCSQRSDAIVRCVYINPCEIIFFHYILYSELNSNGAEFKEAKRIFPAVSGLSGKFKASQLLTAAGPLRSSDFVLLYEKATTRLPQSISSSTTLYIPPMHWSRKLYDLDSIKLSGEISKPPLFHRWLLLFLFSSFLSPSQRRQCPEAVSVLIFVIFFGRGTMV